MFVRTEELRIKWQSFPAHLIINPKQPKEEEVYKYFCSFISNEAIYTRKIKSIIVMSKAAFKNNNPSLQILEVEPLMCYVYSTTLQKTIRCDRVRNEGVIYRIMGDRNILLIINRRNTIFGGLSCVGTAL
jgi:hypothetical protein